MDILSKDQRHKNMAAIHSANTKPEMIVRKYLFSHGFRYRLNPPFRFPGRLLRSVKAAPDAER